MNIVHNSFFSEIFLRDVYEVHFDGDIEEFSLNEDINNLKARGCGIFSKVSVYANDKIFELCRKGLYLVDTNVIYFRPIEKDNGEVFKNVRFATEKDEESVCQLARNAFSISRFHLDPNVPNEIANEIKYQWTRNYFKGERGTHMVVAQVHGHIKGFLLLIKNGKDLIIDLIGVDNSARRQGFASSMIKFAETNVPDVKFYKVGTQISNKAAIRFYEKMGFSFDSASYVFHCFE